MNFNRLTIICQIVAIFFSVFVATSVDADGHSNELIQKLKFIKAEMPEVPPVSRTAAIYLTIQNLSDQPIVIDSVETEIARHAMFHQTLEKNGVAKMQHRDELVIPAKGSLELSQGGTHIMVMGLKELPKNKQFTLYLGNSVERYKLVVQVVARN